MMTVNEYVAAQKARFLRLRPATQLRLCRAARRHICLTPHMADASTFWRGLSPRQVLEVLPEASQCAKEAEYEAQE
jgi:hypothetical protein